MTTQEMLKAIIEAMLKGRWLKKYDYDKTKIEFDKHGGFYIGEPFGKHCHVPHFLILLANSSAMSAAFGDEELVTVDEVCGGCVDCQMKYCDNKSPNHIYLALEAFRITYDKGVESGVRYLYDELQKIKKATAEEG